MTETIPQQSHDTREGWLNAGMRLLDTGFFKPNKLTLPKKLQVSCGFTKSRKDQAIGQCWDPKVSADGTTHMFICPTQADPVRVLDILLHEMIHASVGIEAGHKKPFRDVVKTFGLKGKVTATYAEPGTECHTKLAEIAKALGRYPHAPMRKVEAEKKSKGGSGWVRLMSINDEGYKVVISPKVLEASGFPVDPWGDEMVLVEAGE